MGLSSVEFWQRIAASQLASPLLCRTWAADAATALSASDALDAERVGQQLVSQGKLTQFQLDTLLGENRLPLVRNGYRLLEPVDYALPDASDVRAVWQDWWAVAKTPTAPKLWMRWLQADEFKQPYLAQSNPALPRALQQSQVRHEGLQVVLPPEMASGTLQLCVEPVQGQLLSSQCNGQPQSWENVVALISDVAAALGCLHTAGIAHGRMVPDRVVIDPAGKVLLMRDPLCSATLNASIAGSSGSASGVLASRLPSQLNAAHFMAPEFLLPAQVATPQSDLYSLGCLAWLLLTGKVPFTAKRPEQILAAHAEQPLDLAPLSKLPDPIAKCLWHCLAKNPSARFADAGQLLTALQEARRIVARGPSAVAKDLSTPKAATAKAASAKAEPIAAVTATAADVVPAVVITKDDRDKEPISSPVKQSDPGTARPVVPAAEAETPTLTKTTTKASSKPTSLPSSKAEPAKAKTESDTARPAVVPSTQVTPAQVTPAQVTPAQVTPSLQVATTKPSLEQPAAAQPVAPQPVAPQQAAPQQAAPQPVTPQPVIQQPAAPQSAAPQSAAPQSAAPQSAAQGPAKKRLAQPGKPPSRKSPVRKSKKSQGVNWLTPVIGGGALLVLVLIVMVMSGGFGSSSNDSSGGKPTNKSSNTAANTTTKTPSDSAGAGATTSAVPVDPLADKYELVADAPTALWAPPRLAEPIALDLLPPGGQFFAAVRPANMMKQADTKQLLSLLDADLSPLWKTIIDTSGVPLEQLDQVVVAAYPSESGAPVISLRVKLTEGQPLAQLKSKWQSTTDTKVKEQSLLVSGNRAFYIRQQPLQDSQSVSEYSVGPVELMRDAAEAEGAAAAMSTQMQQLLQSTDQVADLNMLVNPVFFYAEGRAWLDNSPPRFRSELERWVTRDLRAVMFSTSFNDPWYYELRMVGASEREAVVNMQKMSDAKKQLPQAIESWLVGELPHPHWRAMANRFPNMLRAFDAQTRIGSENGQAIVNGYLPIAAAPNLIYASWMAAQPGSTVSSGNVAASNANSQPTTGSAPLTPAQILERKISLSMDQTGIENVLQAIGEQANDKLPAGTKPLRFELDGAGFQLSGITRNQQVKPNFEVKDQTVREALNLLCKKCNPVGAVEDMKSADQKLIWIVLNGNDPEKALLSLTSRDAANAAGHKLPADFAK